MIEEQKENDYLVCWWKLHCHSLQNHFKWCYPFLCI